MEDETWNRSSQHVCQSFVCQSFMEVTSCLSYSGKPCIDVMAVEALEIESKTINACHIPFGARSIGELIRTHLPPPCDRFRGVNAKNLPELVEH